MQDNGGGGYGVSLRMFRINAHYSSASRGCHAVFKNSVPHANEQGAVTIVHCQIISKLTSKERRTSIQELQKLHTSIDRSSGVYVRTRTSLETRPSPSSTRACSVSYNYAWEYFPVFYHVMRAATVIKRHRVVL